MPKLFGLDSSTVRQITKLFALDGSTPRRVKKLFSNDGGIIRLIFEDFSTFTVSGTSNLIRSPVNEVIDFGVRSDFNAGGTDVNVNTSGSGDTSNVGGISGLSIDVDSSHTYSASVAPQVAQSNGEVLQNLGYQSTSHHVYAPTGYSIHNSASNSFRNVLGGHSFSNFYSGSYLLINGSQVWQSGWNGGSIYSSHYNVGSGWGMFSNYSKTFVYRMSGSASATRIRIAGAPSVTSTLTGRRARVVNGSNRPFNVTGGGLSAGGNFSTGSLSAGGATGFITANSTNEAFTLTGVGTKNPATFSISNADNSIQVTGTFGDGENATQARDRIQSVLNGNSTFQSKFNTGTDVDKTVGGVVHKVVTFTSDSAENTSDFSITITQNDGSNTTPYEATTTQGAAESLQTVVTVSREVQGSNVSTATAISSEANADTAGNAVASNTSSDVTYDSSTDKLRVQDQEATVSVSNAGSLSFSKD